MAWHTQNFSTLNARVADLAQLSKHDLVLDLGAGHGELTDRLARRCRRVVAVESDPRLARMLRHKFAEHPNVEVREQDLFALRLPRAPYKVVASIPFDGTARLISRLTSAHHAPEVAYLVVQREAAERVLGQPRQTLFGLIRQPWFEPRIVHHFRRTDFAPAPRVDVVFLRLRKRGPPLLPLESAPMFKAFAEYCFARSRGSVAAALEPLVGHRRMVRIARETGLEFAAPPSLVNLQVWVALFRAITYDERVCKRLLDFRSVRRRLL